MDYLIKNTTKKQRAEIIKKALAISMSGADIPTDEALKIAKEYLEQFLFIKKKLLFQV